LLINCCDATLMIMRMFLMLLIFAIGFSGYSAAAHAFGPDSCDPAMMSQMADDGMDMSDCPGHQAGQDKQKDADTSKTSKAKCMDCTHCCASHAISLSNYSVNFPPLAAVLNPQPMHGYVDDVFSSLLRPPKSLV
jgi:hypothetical protein